LYFSILSVFSCSFLWLTFVTALRTELCVWPVTRKTSQISGHDTFATGLLEDQLVSHYCLMISYRSLSDLLHLNLYSAQACSSCYILLLQVTMNSVLEIHLAPRHASGTSRHYHYNYYYLSYFDGQTEYHRHE
jgi:hypothetical protein